MLHTKPSEWLAVAAAAFVALGSPAVARGDAVTDWNIQATATILAPAPTPHSSTLPFAMVNGAVYDAVNAIDERYQPYLVEPTANPWDSEDAAAATAAFRVLVALYPSQLAALQARYDASLAAIPEGPAKEGGKAAGEAAATAMLDARANDGRNPTTPFPFVFGTTPGAWRVSPPSVLPEPTPWVGNVKPFLVPSAEMLRSDGPNALTSAAYAEDYNEVKSLGSLTSTRRTADQTMAAIFWQAQPIALYSAVMRSLSTKFGLGTADNARLFAMVSLAEADAAIGCWNDKYYWNFWRPIDAIREGDDDGNPETVGDASWKPLFDPATQTSPTLVTPPFPDHPAGHGCVTSATVHTLQDFFGTDKVAFDVFSPRFPGTARHFDRFSHLLKEIIDARVWGGIHFRRADVAGGVIGKKVAHWEQKHYFQPVG